MSKRIVVYLKNGAVTSVDVESADELVSDKPRVVVVDSSEATVTENIPSFVVSSGDIEEMLDYNINHQGFSTRWEVDHDE